MSRHPDACGCIVQLDIAKTSATQGLQPAILAFVIVDRLRKVAPDRHDE
jgi:hypothetical protein